jgi:hypothetical protein
VNLTGVTWSMSAYTGLSINASTGVISGTPLSIDTSTIVVTATNGYGSSSCNFSITITAAPTITSGSTASGTVGGSFSYTIISTGAVFFNATGLPMGLSVNNITGAITGTLTAPGTYYVTLIAQHSPNCSATTTLTITAVCPPCSYSGFGDVASVAGTCLDDTYDVTGDFLCATSLDFAWSVGADGGSFQIIANGSTIYSSGCITGDSSTVVVVPAGTTSLRFIFGCGCINAVNTFVEATLECPP